MKIIAVFFLVLFVGVSSSRAQDANVRTRGGCEIIEARSGATPIDYSFCDRLPRIEYRTYGWLVPVLTLAFDGAERATCGSLRCATGARKVDIVVTDDAFANAGVSLGRAQPGGVAPMVFFLTTGLADMIQASITGYLFQSSDPTNGFRAWLAQIDARANTDCRFILPAPFRALNQQEIKEVFAATSVVYRFVLNHEFAHVMLGTNCGVTSGGPLAQELACDSFAFERQWQAQGMFPHVAIIQFVALAHYDSLLDDRWGAYLFPQSGLTLKEAMPATDWISRANNLARLWQGHCRTANTSQNPACSGNWQNLLQDAVSYVQLTTPRSCRDTGASRQDESRAAGSMEQQFCSNLNALTTQAASGFTAIRGALTDTLDNGTKLYTSLTQLPGVQSCSIFVSTASRPHISCDYFDSTDRAETSRQFETLHRQLSQCLTGYTETNSGTAEEPEIDFRSPGLAVTVETDAGKRVSGNRIVIRPRP